MAKEGEHIGPYLLERRLGRGAYKEVWLATKTNKFGTTRVALGILTGEVDEAALIKEARIWRSVDGHPNVNKLIDIEEFDGQIAILSDFVEGGTLANWLEAHRGEVIEEARILKIVHGILSGLHHLHSQNPPIIHRDLKPGNVLLRNEAPVLTDFGLSRWTEESLASQVAGTPAYMAPEMFHQQYSTQSDIWAVGVIAHRLLSGELPFGEPGMNPLALARVIESEPPRPLPARVSASVVRIVMRALHKNAAARFTSAVEMLRAVESAINRAAPTGMVTVMFTDIVGSTALKNQIAGQTQEERDRFYRQTVKAHHDRLVAEMTDRFDGFMAKDTGDGFVITFGNAERAVLCGLELQKALSERPVITPTGHLQVRIGLNTGHLDYLDGDYIGAAIDKAARIQSSAQPGVVMLSRETYELVAANLKDVDFRRSVGTELKGLGRDDLYVSVFRNDAVTTAVTGGGRLINSVDRAEMIWIPPGSFALGDSDQKNNPVHVVTLSGYYIYKHPVTVAQFRRFVDDVDHNDGFTFDWARMRPAWGWEDDHPMVAVSWHQAAAYCRWAGVRLPSEAEWEHAARGPQNHRFPWGDRFDSGRCTNSVKPNRFVSTTRIGSFAPNGYDLYDMAGNVWQWCRDSYQADYWKPRVAYTNPVNLCETNSRVIKGGSWINNRAEYFRSSMRIGNDAGDASITGGFRCARSEGVA